MKYEIVFAQEALTDLKRLSARNRSAIRDAIKTHLRFEPAKISKSRIKRLRNLKHPQYRLRINDFRLFYDIVEDRVEILAVVSKSEATTWLDEVGEI
ncbi:hypothetical protein MNBD_CHLOROFLEXI01-4209 [hydrothermal vent metagenome]|uniref:RelE/StbE replicon stabilization toxin n=1 Tax=hydrothermal vent metagenome TaxID=652676 RepID=A0A3B0V1Y0_9ZZZZ